MSLSKKENFMLKMIEQNILKLRKIGKRFENEVKLVLLVSKNYSDSQSQIWASALTYFSMLAIFPIIALMLGITKGFGVDKFFEQKLLEFIPQNETMMLKVFDIAENLLNSTRGSILTGVGVIILLWSAIKVLMMLEDSFNTIWRIKKRRSLTRRVIDYVAIIFLGPILFIVVLASNSFVIEKLNSLSIKSGLLVHLIVQIIGFILIALIFSLIYFIIPNTNVKIKSAITAGITTTIMFFILRYGFGFLQSSISKYNAIYGGLAFIPIFLIQMQYVWVTILIGAQISFSSQNSEEFLYKKVSELPIKIRKEMGLSILKLLIDRFENGQDSYTDIEIAKKMNVGIPFVKDTLNDLEEIGLVNEIIGSKVEESKYQIAMNPDKLTVEYFIKKLENKKYNTDKDIKKEVDFSEFEDLLTEEMYKNIEFRNNKLIRDIDDNKRGE
jgi:membrane protein